MITVGDSVLLSCSNSKKILKVSDVNGCQIRLDGEVQSIEGDWCSVLVRCEQGRMRCATVMFKARLSGLEATERVHEWTRFNAKGIDRERVTGSTECEFWAPL